MDKKKWPARSTVLNPLDFFLWGWMKSRMYHSGKPEARHWLVLTTNGAAVVRNELGLNHWHHLMAI
jgi:hypothetical protein